jgi:hypothetical protein
MKPICKGLRWMQLPGGSSKVAFPTDRDLSRVSKYFPEIGAAGRLAA